MAPAACHDRRSAEATGMPAALTKASRSASVSSSGSGASGGIQSRQVSRLGLAGLSLDSRRLLMPPALLRSAPPAPGAATARGGPMLRGDDHALNLDRLGSAVVYATPGQVTASVRFRSPHT